MKTKLPALVILTFVMATMVDLETAASAEAHSPRVTQLFDQGWTFHLGEVEGAQAPAFDDAQSDVLNWASVTSQRSEASER